MKQQMNVRISKLTASQLAALVSKTGMNQTEIISVAIDRMFREITMNTNFVNRQDKIGNAILHLEKLGFNTREVEIIINWVGNGSDEDQLEWLATATKQEITEYAQPAFE